VKTSGCFQLNGSFPRRFNKDEECDSVSGSVDGEEQVSGLSAVSVLSATTLAHSYVKSDSSDE
jgi:hypothetical protein